jgi:endonuclease YncB( thermonuclease family)
MLARLRQSGRAPSGIGSAQDLEDRYRYLDAVIASIREHGYSLSHEVELPGENQGLDGHHRFGAESTLGAWSALAKTITGPVRPMDGDTFEMAGVGVIRLADIDAPEMAQKCQGGPKELRGCGAFVADVLAGRIRGQSIECEVHALDEYERRIASCTHTGDDLSAWLVSEGLALAFGRFSERFVPEEEAARAARRGLWQTTFEPPWEYRARRWEVAAQRATEGCAIKGNINRDGERIYHAPWGSQWYERTKMTDRKGKNGSVTRPKRSQRDGERR